MKKVNMKFGRMMGLAICMMAMVSLTSSCGFHVGSENGAINGTISYKDAELSPRSFTEIEIETVADVVYTQNNGDEQKVKFDFSQIKDADVQKQFQENAVAVYRDGKVIIGLKDKVTGVKRLKQGERLRVYVTSPDLVKVTLEGVGTFSADSINSDVFDIDNEGVGNISIKNLLVNKLKVDNEGVGNVSVGNLQSDHVSVVNEGVGNVRVAQFKGGMMDISNEGVGKVEAQVNCQKVIASLEGVGNIQLSGVTRSLTREKDGVGKIKITDLKVLDK